MFKVNNKNTRFTSMTSLADWCTETYAKCV